MAARLLRATLVVAALAAALWAGYGAGAYDGRTDTLAQAIAAGQVEVIRLDTCYMPPAER